MLKFYKIKNDAGRVEYTEDDSGTKYVDPSAIVTVTNLQVIDNLELTIPPLLKRGEISSRSKKPS